MFQSGVASSITPAATIRIGWESFSTHEDADTSLLKARDILDQQHISYTPLPEQSANAFVVIRWTGTFESRLYQFVKNEKHYTIEFTIPGVQRGELDSKAEELFKLIPE